MKINLNDTWLIVQGSSFWDEYPWFRKDWCQVIQFGEDLENRWK